jgi:hypothetical protein
VEAKMSVDKFQLLQNEYIEWLLLDKHQRAVAGLPTSDVAWSKVKGVNERTVRQWKKHPRFIEKYENRVREKAMALPGATALALTPSQLKAQGKDDRNEHEMIKAKLIERAMAGDRASAELYFKTYGKAFVDEEMANRKSDFRDMDVDGLYQRVLGLLPTEVIEAEIAKRLEVVSE